MMDIIEEAIIYATVMHQGKVRKFSGIPYILHPLEVAQILSTMTDDKEIITAGILHDIVEDTDGTLPEIEKRFGKRVAFIVSSESEEEFPGEDKAATWKRRKEGSLSVLKHSEDIGVKMLWLADKLANIRSLARVYAENGNDMWNNLHQSDPAMQCWYYRSVAETVELSLNKTGAFKEFIDRINYIFPGTFDTAKARYKKYREVSVEGCKLLGQGAKGDIYRYDDELIVKVYNKKNTYGDVEREINLTRKAFVMGLPTAISFGIVSVGKRYGAMFELIDSKTISELIAKNPEHIEYYAGVMADIAKQIHTTSAEGEDMFPDASELLMNWINRAFPDEDDETGHKLTELVKSLPPRQTLVHGDLHTGNVFLSNGEPLFIDVDRMSVGDPVADISGMYLFYVGYAESDPVIIEDFMGFSAETASAFWDSFIRQYLETDDEAEINAVTERAALFAFVRLIGQLMRKKTFSDKDKAVTERLTAKVKELLKTQSP